jgi:hypothetical protein
MIRPSSAAWVFLAVGLCAGLFLVKQQVRGLEARLSQLNESILDDQQAIHVLRAEWSYLNQPSRLDDLGRRLLHLELRDGAGITSIEALRRQHKLKPAIPYLPKPDLDAHISPLVSPGYAQPISITPAPETDRSNDAGWVRAILTGLDGGR